MRKLQHIMTDETALSDLLQRRKRELALEDCIRAKLPPGLAAYVRVADARTAELVLVAASGAAAALLRQRGPQVLEGLACAGWKFTGIRVRVQARPAAEATQKPVAKEIDSASAQVLVALAGRLGDAPLARALKRLAAPGNASRSGGEEQPLESVEDEHREQ